MNRSVPLLMVPSMCAWLLGCGVSGGAIVGGIFANTGWDVVPRFFHKASLLSDGLVMVSGGMTLQIFPPSLQSLRTISFYDPVGGVFSASFVPTGGGAAVSPQLITPRSSHTQTTLPDGRVLIAGGRTGASGTNPGTPINSVEIFSPLTGSVAAGPPMSDPRAGHSATLISEGRVVIAGGSTWQVLDSVSDAWSAPHLMNRSRTDHAAVRLPDHFGARLDGVLVIGGGGTGGNTMEILNPADGSAVLANSLLASAVDDLAAERLENGEVLIVGGQDLSTGNTTVLSFRFNPVTDAILSVSGPPNIPGGISDHRAIPLGRYVAIFGGESQVSGVDTELTYAAIYDHLSDDWIYQGNMLYPHDDFPAVLLNDGRILLIGGGAPLFGNEGPSANTEIFTPEHVLLGDLNDDGKISLDDIPLFAAVILDPESATLGQLCAADTNVDLLLDGGDIRGFVSLLAGP